MCDLHVLAQFSIWGVSRAAQDNVATLVVELRHMHVGSTLLLLVVF